METVLELGLWVGMAVVAMLGWLKAGEYRSALMTSEVLREIAEKRLDTVMNTAVVNKEKERING